MDLTLAFLINLVAGIVGILIVLGIERQRRPGLTRKVGIPGTIDEADLLKRHPTTFLKVQIHNKNVPRWLAWVYDGEPALSCSAWITFHRLDGHKVFDREMVARWSETPEPIVELTKTEEAGVARLVGVQISVDIPAGEYANVDDVAKLKGDDEYYGWSNQSYLHNWRHPSWRFENDCYLAKIRVKSGGREFSDVFMIFNHVPFEDFKIEHVDDDLKNRLQ